jgi:hypothetical protein
MRYLKIFALLVALNTSACIVPREASSQQVSVNFGIFYNELSPYGQWVDYPGYGYVWIPSNGPDFAPYSSDGHWILTDYGWTWVSDYPWGWAPFHYGRWDYDDYYGWFWVPDNEWGPAWVSWRRSPGYYGWAPLRPGISISIAFGREYHERNERWIFVSDRDITRPDISRHYVNQTENVTIINNSTVIVNTRRDNKRNATYITGPDRDDVQKVTGTAIRPVAIRENDRPGQHLSNNELQIYMPQVQRNDENGRKPAPSRVVNLKDIKRSSERNAENPIPNVNPANNNRQEEQPSRSVTPPNKDQPPQPQNIKPSNSRGKEKQPQNVSPPNKKRKVQPSQPKTNQDEKEKGKR